PPPSRWSRHIPRNRSNIMVLMSHLVRKLLGRKSSPSEPSARLRKSRPQRSLNRSDLSFEVLEDRLAPAMFTYMQAAGTLAITLGAGESIVNANEAAGTKTFVLGGAATWTQVGGDAPTSNMMQTLTFNNTLNFATSLTITGGTGTSSVT